MDVRAVLLLIALAMVWAITQSRRPGWVALGFVLVVLLVGSSYSWQRASLEIAHEEATRSHEAVAITRSKENSLTREQHQSREDSVSHGDSTGAPAAADDHSANAAEATNEKKSPDDKTPRGKLTRFENGHTRGLETAAVRPRWVETGIPPEDETDPATGKHEAGASISSFVIGGSNHGSPASGKRLAMRVVSTDPYSTATEAAEALDLAIQRAVHETLAPPGTSDRLVFSEHWGPDPRREQFEEVIDTTVGPMHRSHALLHFSPELQEQFNRYFVDGIIKQRVTVVALVLGGLLAVVALAFAYLRFSKKTTGHPRRGIATVFAVLGVLALAVLLLGA